MLPPGSQVAELTDSRTRHRQDGARIMSKPVVITVTHGSCEWDSLLEALDQYTDNQRDYLENHCEPGEEKRGARNLKFAQKILDKMVAAIAARAEESS